MEQACGYSYIYIILIVVLVVVLVVISNRRNWCLSGSAGSAATAGTKLGPGARAGGKPRLINYNTTWCPHSVRLEPEWDKVARLLKGTGIEVSNVKCDKIKGGCPKQIKGFPTIVLAHGSKTKEYQGARSAEAIVAFAKKYA
jgi:thiol-disulfide isomerase/thioredoxin